MCAGFQKVLVFFSMSPPSDVMSMVSARSMPLSPTSRKHEEEQQQNPCNCSEGEEEESFSREDTIYHTIRPSTAAKTGHQMDNPAPSTIIIRIGVPDLEQTVSIVISMYKFP